MQRAFLPSLVLLTLVLVPVARPDDEPLAAGSDVGLYRACGLNCLAVVLNWRGTPAPLATIESRLHPRPNGESSVADLERAARSFGLEPASVRVSLRQLPALPLPAIVHLRSQSASSDASHYVVVLSLAQRGVVILDPPNPPSYMPYEDFARTWSGVSISFPRDQAERNRFLDELRRESSWTILLPSLIGALSALLIIMLLRSEWGRWSRGGRSLAASIGRARLCGALVVVGFIVPLAATAAGCSRTPAAPRLALPDTHIDLGLHEVGSVPFTIPIRNGGDEPLLIYEARSSCACTVAEVPKTPILATQGGEIRGKISVRSGEGSAEILVATNEPEGNPRKILLTWFGKHVPTLVPTVIDLGARRGEIFERIIELGYPGGDPEKRKIEYLGVAGLPPATTLTLVDDNPAALQVNPVLSRVSMAGRATFRLRTQAPAALGDQRTIPTIKIRQQGVQYDLPFTLVYHVDEGVRTIPASLTFSGSSGATLGAVKRQVVVVSDQPLGMIAVDSKPEYLNCEVRSQGANRGAVVFQVVGPVPPGVTRGEVVLRDASGRRATVATTIHYLPESGVAVHAPASG